MRVSFSLISVLVILICGCAKPPEPKYTAAGLPSDGLYAEFVTSRGSVLAELYFEHVPMTVAHFVALAEGRREINGLTSGIRFYDHIFIHHVEAGRLIQTGDPTGTGTGSTGEHFPDEFHPELKHDAAGILTMANALEPDTNSSQFMIMLRAEEALNGRNAVFGKVVAGLEILSGLQVRDRIEQVVILRRGEAAEAFKPDEAAFQQFVEMFLAERVARVEAKIREQWPQATRAEAGYFSEQLVAGDGAQAAAGKVARIHYQTKVDGEVVDDSRKSGSSGENTALAIILGAGKTAPWLEEVLTTMAVGAKTRVLLPSHTKGMKAPRGLLPEVIQYWEIELVAVETRPAEKPSKQLQAPTP